MDWIQFAIFLLGVVGLWFWNRSESSADRREIISILLEMKNEMKDFHGRLCAIEERNRK